MNGKEVRGLMAYQASRKKPAQAHTQVAHLIANKLILRAMQEGRYLQELLELYSETFPKDFTENDVLGALKKIADSHRHKVGKDEQYTA